MLVWPGPQGVVQEQQKQHNTAQDSREDKEQKHFIYCAESNQ